MAIKNFQLSYYNNSTEDFHIQSVKNPQLATKPHTHSYFQIYYVICGKLYHYVGDKRACMERGDMFIVPPDVMHYVSAEEGTTFYSFSFVSGFLIDSPEAPHIVANFLRNLLKNGDLKIRATLSLPSEEILYIESLMAHIEKEFKNKPIGYYDTVRTLAILIVGYLARSYYEEHSTKEHVKANREVIRHCIEYIENNYFEKINIDEIAKELAMSQSGFCKLFLLETGRTFSSYLNRRRIEKACEYIEKNYKLTTLYPYVGYNDFSTFYRNFKKYVGVCPSKYKQNLAKG